MGDRVWVYLQRSAEGVIEGSLQGLAFGHPLAQTLGCGLEGVCIGGAGEPLKEIPGGVARIYHLVGQHLQDYRADVYGAALEGLVQREAPKLILFPSSTEGEDLASWLGAALGVGVLLGVREIRWHERCFIGSRVEYEGKVAVEYELRGQPVIVTVEEGTVSTPNEAAGEAEIIEISEEGPSDDRLRVLKTEIVPRAANLKEARVVVAVGAGVGTRDCFEQIEELARMLGGEIGGTRAAVDAGWVSYDRQIGQTGLKVKPALYVACGISGAAQHRVGMIDSETIVSINVDPHAPIFRFSHYCVEGDLKAVLPKLLQLLRR